MSPKDFNELVERRFKLAREVLTTKGIEYSTAGDKLHNFKRAAAMDGETPEEALWGMLKKHLVSVMDAIEKIDRFGVTQAWIDEKLGDCQNYFILLEGLMTERLRARKEEAFKPIGGRITVTPGAVQELNCDSDPGDEDRFAGEQRPKDYFGS